jgi:hypothetical protein
MSINQSLDQLIGHEIHLCTGIGNIPYCLCNYMDILNIYTSSEQYVWGSIKKIDS